MQDFISNNIARYYDILNAQIFLQEQGVSFSYTDSIPYFERNDLISAYSEFLTKKSEHSKQELGNK